MPPFRVLSDEQFRQLSTDEKYLYINEMLRRIVASRPKPNASPAELVGAQLERVAQKLTEADYARLADSQKIHYLENLIDELVATVKEAQKALSALRAGTPVVFR